MSDKQATKEDIKNTDLTPVDAELGATARNVGDYKVVGKKSLSPDEFRAMMDNWFNFVEEASSWQTSMEAESYVKSSQYGQEELLNKIKSMGIHEFYQDNGVYYIKTPDNKIENMGDYVMRLCRTSIDWMKKSNEWKTKYFESVEEYTKLAEGTADFWGYIKLAFKSLSTKETENVS